VFATAIFLPQLRAVAIFLSQLRATAAQFFAITGHSAIAVAPQLRRILTAIQNMGSVRQGGKTVETNNRENVLRPLIAQK